MDTTRQAATQYKKVYSSAEELKEWRGTGEETPIIFSKRMHSSLFGLETGDLVLKILPDPPIHSLDNSHMCPSG